MPWHKEQGGGTCGDDEWAVILDEDGSTAGCHATEEDADAQIAALNANDANDADAAVSNEFDLVILPEGVRTTDDREFEAGSLAWRELPLPLMWQQREPDGFNPHGESVLVGQITEVFRNDAGEIRGHGTWDTSENAVEARRLVDTQMLRWVSADVEMIAFDILEEGDCDDMWILFAEEGDSEPADEPCKMILHVTEGRLMGATMVAFPAFPQAVIVPAGSEIPASSDDGRPAVETVPSAADLAAATGPVRTLEYRPEHHASIIAHAAPQAPPRAWFENPALSEPTPLTLTDDGRLYTHAALWSSCHVGYGERCVAPPASPSDYAYFRTGVIETAEGDEVAVGAITLGGGHADIGADWRGAQSHYDDVGSVVAYVAAGSDDHGIWVAGALKPGITDEQRRALKAASLSGDWRTIGGTLELVALLAVNVPGFPVPRAAARVASGRPAALVAAGVRQARQLSSSARVLLSMRAEIAALRAELARASAVTRALGPAAAAALVQRVGGDR